ASSAQKCHTAVEVEPAVPSRSRNERGTQTKILQQKMRRHLSRWDALIGPRHQTVVHPRKFPGGEGEPNDSASAIPSIAFQVRELRTSAPGLLETKPTSEAVVEMAGNVVRRRRLCVPVAETNYKAHSRHRGTVHWRFAYKFLFYHVFFCMSICVIGSA